MYKKIEAPIREKPHAPSACNHKVKCQPCIMHAQAVGIDTLTKKTQTFTKKENTKTQLAAVVHNIQRNRGPPDLVSPPSPLSSSTKSL